MNPDINDEERLLEKIALSAEGQTRIVGVDTYFRQYRGKEDRYQRPPKEIGE
jgi:hypothetical protein